MESECRDERGRGVQEAHSSGSGAGPKKNKYVTPRTVAASDAPKIASFESSISDCLPANARFVIKIDIVNPMPPSIPTPTTCRQVSPLGSVDTPNMTAR